MDRFRMDSRQRIIYPTANQKKKLLELMAKHPELISSKVTSDFNHKDLQRLWLNIANECNSIPGAKKTWRQWRKTWQDMKSKIKKKQVTKGEITASVITLSIAEQEALGFKNVSSTTANYQETTEFVPLEVNNVQESFDNEMFSTASLSEPESPPEVKIFTHTEPTAKTMKKLKSEHSNSCLFNCDMLAVQEQRKIQIKEDYYNFKQDYLRQKLLLMKEQTEALKSIAKELSKQ